MYVVSSRNFFFIKMAFTSLQQKATFLYNLAQVSIAQGNFLSHILHMAMAPIHGTSRFTCIISNICCIMPIGVIFARPRLFSDSSPRALRWAVTSVSSGIMSFKCTSLMILPSLDISDAALLRISSTPV